HPTSSSISSTDTSTSKIYTLSLHDALPIFRQRIYKYQINIGLYFCIIIIIIHLLKALYYHPEIPLLKLHSFCRRYTYYLLLHLFLLVLRSSWSIYLPKHILFPSHYSVFQTLIIHNLVITDNR